MQVLASQLHFLANKNAELAILPLFWPVNCIKIGGHVALLCDPTVYSLYCDIGQLGVLLSLYTPYCTPMFISCKDYAQIMLNKFYATIRPITFRFFSEGITLQNTTRNSMNHIILVIY